MEEFQDIMLKTESRQSESEEEIIRLCEIPFNEAFHEWTMLEQVYQQVQVNLEPAVTEELRAHQEYQTSYEAPYFDQESFKIVQLLLD